MFERSVYTGRRQALRSRLRSGLVLLPGGVESPINFAHNVRPFRQDSTVSYFFGVSRPGLAAVIDLDEAHDAVFGDDAHEDDEIWMGRQVPLVEMCAAAGCGNVRSRAALIQVIGQALQQGRTVHYLPPWCAATSLELAQLLGCSPREVGERVSHELIRAVVSLREIKSDVEVAEIEKAISVADEMHRTAMLLTAPGVYEREVVAAIRQVIGHHGLQEAYQPIFTRRGEILHNFDYSGKLERGELVVNDSGAETLLGYASDITRTLPVSGRFNPRQRDLYQVLVDAQESAIGMIRPGVTYAEVHRHAAIQLVEGMSALGFFRGDAREVVSSGAYAICFPHGLGHQLGLDVHDMEALGEDHVGYDETIRRSELFGLRNLRMARRLEPGMVLTVEPGIYFIPALIQRWSAQRQHAQFIDYDQFHAYLDYGGMRVEDEVLVISDGARVLGPHIPKSVAEVEGLMAV